MNDFIIAFWCNVVDISVVKLLLFKRRCGYVYSCLLNILPKIQTLDNFHMKLFFLC